MNPLPAHRGFSLLEMLAVVVILSLGLSVALAGVSSVSGATALRRDMAAVRHFDAHARLSARRHGTSSLTISADGGHIRRNDIAAHRFAGDHRVVLRNAEHREITSIVFDRSGASIDYSVGFRPRGVTLRVAGLTGQCREDTP